MYLIEHNVVLFNYLAFMPVLLFLLLDWHTQQTISVHVVTNVNIKMKYDSCNMVGVVIAWVNFSHESTSRVN